MRGSPAAGASGSSALASTVTPANQAAWVKNPQSRSGNMSIMTAEKRLVAVYDRTDASAQLQARPARPRRAPAHIQTIASSSSSDGQRVVIDGVVFQFEQGGAKLSRVGGESSRVMQADRQKWRLLARPPAGGSVTEETSTEGRLGAISFRRRRSERWTCG